MLTMIRDFIFASYSNSSFLLISHKIWLIFSVLPWIANHQNPNQSNRRLFTPSREFWYENTHSENKCAIKTRVIFYDATKYTLSGVFKRFASYFKFLGKLWPSGLNPYASFIDTTDILYKISLIMMGSLSSWGRWTIKWLIERKRSFFRHLFNE